MLSFHTAGGRPHKGPAALGVRLQQTLEGRLPGPGSVPAQLSVAGAYMTTLPHDGPGADLSMDPMAEGDRETCLGVNMELVTELQRLMGRRWEEDELFRSLGLHPLRMTFIQFMVWELSR